LEQSSKLRGKGGITWRKQLGKNVLSVNGSGKRTSGKVTVLLRPREGLERDGRIPLKRG